MQDLSSSEGFLLVKIGLTVKESTITRGASYGGGEHG